MNVIKDFATSSISNLACCKFVALKENNLSPFQNYYRNQTEHTPQGVFYGGSRFTTKGRIRELSDKFKQKFCQWCTFSQFYDHEYLKELIVVKSLIRKQSPVELFPWTTPPCIPYLAKNVSPPFILLVTPHHVWTALLLPPNLPFGGKSCRRGRTQPNSKQKNANFPHQKYPLTKY